MHKSILFENTDCLIINKPFPWDSHNQSFLATLQLYLPEIHGACNTLSKDYSGVLVLMKENGHIASMDIEKRYVFLSTSRPRRKGIFTERTSSNNLYCFEYQGYEDSNGVAKIISKAGMKIYGNSKSFPRLALHLQSVKIDNQWISTEIPDSFTALLTQQSSLVTQATLAWERRFTLPFLSSDCCRLIHRGELSIPASIDIYGDKLLISAFADQENSEQLYHALTPVLDFLQNKTGYTGGLLRKHALNPHRTKLAHDTYCFGNDIAETTLVSEHGLQYAVNINDSQHVGLFLDMRDMRKRVMEIAKGRRIANLFSFTCSFSLAAVQADAEVVFSVDLAGSTLNRGKENFRLNNLEECGRGKFVKEDVMKWLTRQEKRKERDGEDYQTFDLIICDPPVFASAGKGQGFHVEKQWPTLARQIRLLLSDNGIALMANNHRGGDGGFYLKELKKQFSKVEQLPPALDFPRLTGSPEHVRIYWCEV